MFSTELSTGFLVLSLLLVLFAVAVFWWVKALAVRVSEAIAYLHQQNKNSVSLRRIAEVESTLTELSDSYEVLLKSVRKLGARARTRANRDKGGDSPIDSGAGPGDEVERARYKAQLREQAHQKRML